MPSPAHSDVGNESDSGESIATAPPAVAPAWRTESGTSPTRSAASRSHPMPNAGLKPAAAPPNSRPSASTANSTQPVAAEKTPIYKQRCGSSPPMAERSETPTPVREPLPPQPRPTRAQSQAPSSQASSQRSHGPARHHYPHSHHHPHHPSHHYNHHNHQYHHYNSHGHNTGIPLEQFQADLTQAIVSFLNPLTPSEEEYRVKEALRRNLERISKRIDPTASLLAFGSMANGFALRNSDMDLCCLISPRLAYPEQVSTPSNQGGNSAPPAPPGTDAPVLSSARASELVEQLSQLIRENTDFIVMPLPQARIPIIKILKRTSASCLCAEAHLPRLFT